MDPVVTSARQLPPAEKNPLGWEIAADIQPLCMIYTSIVGLEPAAFEQEQTVAVAPNNIEAPIFWMGAHQFFKGAFRA